MTPRDWLARDLATALLAGEWSRADMPRRLMLVLELVVPSNWMSTLVDRVLARFDPYLPPRHEELCQFIQEDVVFRRGVSASVRRARRRAASTGSARVPTNLLALPSALMAPHPAIPGTSQLPPLVTPMELADWLALSPNELDWFADCHGRERHTPIGKLRHYRYRWIAKSGGRKRLVESPKPRLRQIQRKILDDILSPIPPHPAAHAFRRGCSTLSFASPHVGRRVVLRIDLRDFFPAIRSARTHALFHALGYPELVARILTGLCTNSIPESALPTDLGDGQRFSLRKLFGQPHLPQGAPTSPALANLCAYRLDCRLAGLAQRAQADYTRYADDLVFSGDVRLEKNLDRFRVLVCAIVLDEGFQIRHRKTHVMRSGKRQSIAGIVVNQRPNITRGDFDNLKAVLHNVWRFGPQSQNRDGHERFREHLQGRIAYVRMIHLSRGEKLQAMFDRISWDSTGDS